MREIHRRSLRRISPRPDGSGSALSCARLSSRPDADACGAGGWALASGWASPLSRNLLTAAYIPPPSPFSGSFL